MTNEIKQQLRRSLKAGVIAFRNAWANDRYTERLVQPLSEGVVQATRRLRGENPPAIVVHGVMPRSGTNYLGDLIGLHPQVTPYANNIWEFPLLHSTPAIQELQKVFISGYRGNQRRFKENDFLALIGESFIAYLHTHIGPEKRLVMKVPLCSHLAQFELMFPHESCVMIMRDGRDVTASTIRSWPGRDFAQVVREWRDAATYMMTLDHPLYRYEDIVADPPGSIREICRRFSIDETLYPYEQINRQPLRGSSESIDRQGWNAVERPKDFNPIGRWQNWSRRQKNLFKRIAGKALVQTGYETDDAW
jgi:protein-tyrosine sulfotransferase